MKEYTYSLEEDNEYDSLISIYVTLIWHLIEEIKEADLEIVSLRYILSECMTEEGRENMRMDIFSSLYPLCTDQEDFEYFKDHHCDGEDPFNDKSFWRKLRKAAEGEKVGWHPNISTSDLK